MARDQCIDCDKHFPGGEGLVEGRCSSCLADFEERQRAAKKAARAATKGGEED